MSNKTLRYIGAGFIIGVPSRDLTAEEAAQYSTLIQEQEAITGVKLYAPIKAEPAPSSQAEAPATKRKQPEDTSGAPAAEGGN